MYTIGNSSTQDVLHVLLFPGLSGSVIVNGDPVFNGDQISTTGVVRESSTSLLQRPLGRSQLVRPTILHIGGLYRLAYK